MVYRKITSEEQYLEYCLVYEGLKNSEKGTDLHNQKRIVANMIIQYEAENTDFESMTDEEFEAEKIKWQNDIEKDQ